MIHDKLENTRLYFREGDAFDRAVAFVKAFDAATPDGRHAIDGDDLFALVSSYETSPAEERRFEAHRKYIDLQVVMEGEERIDASLDPSPELLEEYSVERDIVFWGPPARFVSLAMTPGCFAVFFPHELHRPNCHLEGKRKVRKIVVKIRMR